ncbi:MAG TPA: SH3 domain-containing protein [Polyangiaceae bacterium]|nr:SH3 domain-containing protein [Polyangiaceae bacterium]
MSRLALSAAVVLCALPARAQSEVDAFARVVVYETELRSGPGVSYRVIHRARRGDAFLIRGRETKGFWLEIEMADGRTAYVLGDTVETVGVGENDSERPSKPGLFAPPALQEARGGFALLAGIYDRDGYAEFRPAFVIAPAIAFEPYIGLAMQSDGRRLIYGGAGTLNLAPDWPIAPFVEIGLGGMLEQPKDEFIRKERKWFHTRAGGGLLVSFRLRVLVRLEATNVVLFGEDEYQNTQAYVAGLGTYF